ncbi:patatin-like phospholipase family protein [Agarivorans sp. QJM3NY_33]|uniref:patatin-like phospholipase family protein n=1 Tax=Agarivorans sp. QJM3NY_33 TaxID=3421432 RepID=UPI003D7E1B50
MMMYPATNCFGPCQQTPIVENTALVAEGGGQRGIFTAGVLDSWMSLGFNPFQLLIGTSAGAQNLSSYMSCQHGFAQKSITETSRHARFFKLSRSLTGRSIIDLDWYFEQVNRPADPLNVNSAASLLRYRRLLFATTNTRNKAAHYFSPSRDNWLHLLKASSALPYLYKGGVEIEGEHYVDGGLAAPIPVEEAYRRGAKTIVVIRTKQQDYVAESPWSQRLKTWVCQSGECPKALDYQLIHEQAYQQSLDFMHQPPEDAQVFQIHPSQALSSKLLGSKTSALEQDYQLGLEAGFRFVEQFEQTTPLGTQLA